MTLKFDVDKIVKYLERYKFDLPTLYKWDAKIENLVVLETLTQDQVKKLNTLIPYEKELQLKKIVGEKLNETLKSNKNLFNKLCLWVVKDWGGISTASDNDTLILIDEFLKHDKPNFKRIASSSKIGAYLFPDKNVIFDSRVAYSLNWIILSEDAGQYYFPIPEGRNSKMAAFDLNTLIRLKNISNYHPQKIEDLDNRLFIKNADDKLFIKKADAYFELNHLVRKVSENLWKGDSEKVRNLYYTEMLLFSIADKEVFCDMTSQYGIIGKMFKANL